MPAPVTAQESGRTLTLERLAAGLLAGLWALEICRLVLPGAPFQPVALGGFALYLALAMLKARRMTLLLCAALGTVALLTAITSAGPGRLIAGLDGALVFTAFIPTLAWLRAAAERSPAIAASQAAFASMSGRTRETGMMVGAHLLGAILTAGIFGLFAPLLPKDLKPAERLAAAQATVRGMCLAVLWSPCFVGMAVASRLLPDVALWQTIPIGMGFAALGLVLADLLFGVRRPRLIWQAIAQAFRPVLPPLVLGAGAVVAVIGLTPLSSLNAVLSILPPLGLLWLLASRPRELPAAILDTWHSLGRMGDDLLVVALAMVLAAVLSGSPAVERVLAAVAALGLPPVALIGGTLGLMLLAAFLGLHPMVGISVLVPLVAGLPGAVVAQPILLLVALYGWSLGTLNSISSLSVVLAGASFGVPIERLLLGRNLAFVLIFGAISIPLLTVLNALWV